MPTKVYADEMSIEQAYRTMGKQRMKLDIRGSLINDNEIKYLDHMFFVIELAMRERVVMLKYITAGKSDKYIDKYNTEIDNLLISFDLIQAPTKGLKEAETMIIEIIEEQKKFFNDWHREQGTSYYLSLSDTYTSHRLVQSNHKKLLILHHLLLRLNSSDSSYNLKVLYNHLCALDFI